MPGTRELQQLLNHLLKKVLFRKSQQLPRSKALALERQTYQLAEGVLSPEVSTYWEQAFSASKPAPYDYSALRQQCEHTKWREDVYLDCRAIAAGLTTILSQIKVCFKMAVEAGTGLILPAMALRDSTDLRDFRFLNADAYYTYDKWFDAAHLMEQAGKACPKMKFLHPSDLDTPKYPVKQTLNMDIAGIPGYRMYSSFFWVGRPFSTWFDEEYDKLQEEASKNPAIDQTKKGITIMAIGSFFLLFRITDDPSGFDLHLWNDLAKLIRFREDERSIINALRTKIDRPYYGVHFRVENDTIWTSVDDQLSRDIDVLDSAFAKYSAAGDAKPLVYLACGDESQAQKFISAGKKVGWDVTHKWALLEDDPKMLAKLGNLAFDFQGGIDMGMMIRSDFFVGISGSAFSFTVANMRDVTGRYRGSSLRVWDDANARSHLVYVGDASQYACCL